MEINSTQCKRLLETISDSNVDMQMIMSAIKLVENNPKISEKEIRKGLEGNICRCTGYNIVKNL